MESWNSSAFTFYANALWHSWNVKRVMMRDISLPSKFDFSDIAARRSRSKQSSNTGRYSMAAEISITELCRSSGLDAHSFRPPLGQDEHCFWQIDDIPFMRSRCWCTTPWPMMVNALMTETRSQSTSPSSHDHQRSDSKNHLIQMKGKTI